MNKEFYNHCVIISWRLDCRAAFFWGQAIFSKVSKQPSWKDFEKALDPARVFFQNWGDQYKVLLIDVENISDEVWTCLVGLAKEAGIEVIFFGDFSYNISGAKTPSLKSGEFKGEDYALKLINCNQIREMNSVA